MLGVEATDDSADEFVELLSGLVMLNVGALEVLSCAVLLLPNRVLLPPVLAPKACG